MSEARKAIGLLSSMVSGGEAHSDVSRQQVNKAFGELAAMERVIKSTRGLKRMPSQVTIGGMGAVVDGGTLRALEASLAALDAIKGGE